MLSYIPVFHGQHSSTNGLFDVNFFRKWRSGQGLASERFASSLARHGLATSVAGALHDHDLPSQAAQPAPWLGSTVDREPASRSRLHTRNRYPLAKSQRFWPRRACRDDHSVRLYQSSCQRDQLADITGAAHDDALEATLELTEQVLDSTLDDVGSFEFQLTYRAREKSRSTPARFDERDLEFAADDLDRESR